MQERGQSVGLFASHSHANIDKFERQKLRTESSVTSTKSIQFRPGLWNRLHPSDSSWYLYNFTFGESNYMAANLKQVPRPLNDDVILVESDLCDIAVVFIEWNTFPFFQQNGMCVRFNHYGILKILKSSWNCLLWMWEMSMNLLAIWMTRPNRSTWTSRNAGTGPVDQISISIITDFESYSK